MTVQAADAQVERGKYVVEIIGCTELFIQCILIVGQGVDLVLQVALFVAQSRQQCIGQQA